MMAQQRFTVVLYGDISYEPGHVVIVRVEAASPIEAARLAEKQESSAANPYDYVDAHAVFAGWLDDLLPDDYWAASTEQAAAALLPDVGGEEGTP